MSAPTTGADVPSNASRAASVPSEEEPPGKRICPNRPLASVLPLSVSAIVTSCSNIWAEKRVLPCRTRLRCPTGANARRPQPQELEMRPQVERADRARSRAARASAPARAGEAGCA
eukprot:scaffold118910_cov30-Tisochrysis_lutea.AAC.1